MSVKAQVVFTLLSASLLVTACGGGGGGSQAPAPVENNQPGSPAPSSGQPSPEGVNGLYVGQMIHQPLTGTVYAGDLASGANRPLAKYEDNSLKGWYVSLAGGQLLLTEEVLGGNGTNNATYRYRIIDIATGRQVDQWPDQVGSVTGALVHRLSPDNSVAVGGVFQYGWNGSHLLARDRQGNTLFDFTEAGYDRSFAFLPDGRMVATDPDGWLTLFGKSFSPESRIRRFAGAVPGSVKASPDGQRLAFVLAEDGAPWHIFVMNIDGTGLHQVTTSQVGEGSVAWSPDGRSLLVYEGGYNDACGTPFVVSADEQMVDISLNTADSRARELRLTNVVTGSIGAVCSRSRVFWTN